MCGLPYAYMAPAYEPERYVENGTNTDHAEEVEETTIFGTRYLRRSGLGGTQGGSVVPLRVGHPVHGVVSRRDRSVR